MGKLYFYYSAMNAGKTTTLLQSAFNYNERGMNVLLFTPAIDDRYGVGFITSRIGLQAPAFSFGPEFNFYEYLVSLGNDKEPSVPARNDISNTVRSSGSSLKQKYSCILVDEAQFLSKQQVLQLTACIDEFGIPVLAYGIRSDFRGEPFEGSRYLLAWADEMIEIKTICHCGHKATFNARINDNGQMETAGNQIEIGGNHRYVSLCRKHFQLASIYLNPRQEVASSSLPSVPCNNLTISPPDSSSTGPGPLKIMASNPPSPCKYSPSSKFLQKMKRKLDETDSVKNAQPEKVVRKLYEMDALLQEFDREVKQLDTNTVAEQIDSPPTDLEASESKQEEDEITGEQNNGKQLENDKELIELWLRREEAQDRDFQEHLNKLNELKAKRQRQLLSTSNLTEERKPKSSENRIINAAIRKPQVVENESSDENDQDWRRLG